jgi:hypothetical protein
MAPVTKVVVGAHPTLLPTTTAVQPSTMAILPFQVPPMAWPTMPQSLALYGFLMQAPAYLPVMVPLRLWTALDMERWLALLAHNTYGQ